MRAKRGHSGTLPRGRRHTLQLSIGKPIRGLAEAGRQMPNVDWISVNYLPPQARESG